MDRFRWLEFGDSEPAPPTPEEGAPGALGRTFLERADALLLEGEHERALREYARAVDEDRALFDAWAGQVRAQLAMGELPQARVWADKALELFPDSPRVVSAAALVLASLGATEDALRVSDRALELAGSAVPPALWLERAEVLLLAGRREPAQDCLDRVRSATGDDPDWQQRMGLAFLAGGQPELAQREFNAALERRPERAWLWFLAGRTARALQQHDRALFALERALALKPGLAEAQKDRNALRRAPAPWVSTLLGWLGRGEP